MDLKILREKVLSDCAPHESFWTCHGIICRNIYELATNIEEQSQETFRYHVRREEKKNDYAEWIAKILKDEILAERVRFVYDKDLFVDILRDRIKELESA